MGNGASRIDRFYGNYEKSFERIEQDIERLKGRSVARVQRKGRVSRWAGGAVVLAISVSVVIVYQVQQRPAGTYSYQQHFSRIGVALALPAVAFVSQWMLLLLLGFVEGRDSKKIKALEAAKRSMIKELKDMSHFDKIKSLVDKFDPDVQKMPLGAATPGGPGTPTSAGQLSNTPRFKQQGLKQQQSAQVPGLIMKGSGQVAGAAALAVAGAGKAIMPLFDKLATSLISDNPMLLEDLRRAQLQLQDAEVRMVGAVQENCAVKLENIALKQRLVDLEQQLKLPPSFDTEALQEQLQQQQQAQQQLPWVMQQCVQAGAMGQPGMPPSSDFGPGPSSWPGESSGFWAGGNDSTGAPQHIPGAISAPQTPVSSAAAAAAASGAGGMLAKGDVGDLDHGAAEGMGEGLQGSGHEEQLVQPAAGLRQRKAGALAE